MKRVSIFILIAAAAFLGACANYLDVNTNPNQPTAVTANLILPQALTATSFVLNGYNTYGSQLGGMASNAGGYGGFNEYVTYSYTSGSWGLWGPTYDNLEDYQYIINQTTGSKADIYFNAIATIMRVHGFQLLVDTYNKVPYTHALKGAADLTPAYDDGATIYPALAIELDSAMARINRGLNFATKPNPPDNYDIVFKGNMTNWLKLANTLKLKLIIRGTNNSGTAVSFTNTTFDPVGFLTTDALINPGFTRDINRENPAWNNWAYAYTGSAGNKAWVPTLWMLSWYDGTNLSDIGRGKATYFEFALGAANSAKLGNRLGVETVNAPKCPTGGRWYPGADRTGTSAGNSTGVLKGPDAGYPLFTAAESYFLQAEASLGGSILPGGNDLTNFRAGVTASFKFLYTLANGTTVTGNPAADAATYMDVTNVGSYLANYAVASGTLQKTEAIITQKYIALNYIHSHEAWNEYRRTGYPTVNTQGVASRTATNTFASIVSNQTARLDGLPTRILYPTAEAQYNPNNLPTGTDTFTSLIFWAK